MNARMDMTQFKGTVRKGLVLPPATLLRKSMSVRVEPSDQPGRTKLFTISTAGVDRDNDTIALKGWDLGAYKNNPVVLWGHESYAPPIGRSLDIYVEGDALKAVVEFVPADMPLIGEQAEMIYRMCDLGFLSACSVGFRPTEYVVAKDRMGDDDWWPPVDFTKQELLEWSICTIPANPEATIDPSERAAHVAERKAALVAAEQATLDAAAQDDAARTAAFIARRRQLRAACV